MQPERGDHTDKTFDEAIAGVRKAERGVEVREDLAQGFEYVKQYAEAVIARQEKAVQSANTATAMASTATAKASEATNQATAAVSSAMAAAASQTAAKTSADNAADSAAAAQKSAQEAAAAANTDTTLTVAGAPADSKTVGDRLSGVYKKTEVYTKEQVDALLANFNACPFEVGDILQTTSSTSPAARFGGTWEQIASERVLMGASSTHAAGTTAEAGLPNITGTFAGAYYSGSRYEKYDGAFSRINSSSNWFNDGDGSGKYHYSVGFDASKSNAVYGRSSTVQPAAYYVYIWRRTA